MTIIVPLQLEANLGEQLEEDWWVVAVAWHAFNWA